MEKFWAVILIFVVVAAAGLMYVNQVYIPQKDTQMAMADMANQTLSAVKLEIGDSTVSREVKGNEIKGIIERYVNNNGALSITIDARDYADVDDISDITDFQAAVNSEEQYYMRVTSSSGKISKLSFTKI